MMIKNLQLVISFLIFFLVGFIVGTQMNQQPVIPTFTEQPPPSPEHTVGTAPVAAVAANGDGVLGTVTAQLTDGTGLVLINTNPFLEPDTQFSANVAAAVAQNVTGKDRSRRNIIYDFEINGTVVGGPSAGAAMTLATIAAMENKSMNNIVITGTILPNGAIGPVGGILEKGQAAIQIDAEYYLIPAGQSTMRYYEREVRESRSIHGFRIFNTYLVPRTVNVTEYYQQQGLRVQEVETIQEAMKYAFIDE